jgi:hypothetical protein
MDLGPANPIKQTSQEYGDLGQRRRHADINATAVLRAILPRLGPTGTKWRYASSPHARAAKAIIFFEYLVDELSTWIAGDQLRISLSPTLLAELKGNLLRHERHVLDILRNRLLTEHILNSVFSRSLEPSTLCSPSSIQQLRLMARTAILQEPLEVPPVPLLHQAQHRAASLRRGSGEGRGGTRTGRKRSAATATIP